MAHIHELSNTGIAAFGVVKALEELKINNVLVFNQVSQSADQEDGTIRVHAIKRRVGGDVRVQITVEDMTRVEFPRNRAR